jgi:abortive infection bacteriophage resistance protein
MLPPLPIRTAQSGEAFYFFMAKTPYTKPFISLQEQLKQLKLRGLKFTDEVKALHLLKYIGYYRFSGYWYPLLADKQKHIFKPDANFETAFSLYKFDCELRKLIIAELEKIEIAVRTQMAYSLSTTHGSFWIDDENLFVNSVKYRATLDKINSEIQRSDEDFITAFASKYANPLPPSFITLEIVSFGTLSKLYENLKSDVAKREISQTFGLPDMVFISWLHGLTYIRNVCAHHARLWNKLLQIQPLFPRRTQHKWITSRNVRNNHIYYILSIIIYFLNTINPKHTFRQKLENLFAKYPNVDKVAMGFPPDWQAEPLWQ